MKSNEFRVGITLNRKHGKGWTTEVINEEMLGKIFNDQSQELAIDDFEPIPLSKQELIRLGFKKWRKQYSINVGGELSYYWDNGTFIIWQINEGAYTLDSVFRGVSSPKPSRVFNEVHVLQNIAYYLHGQELEYKLDSGLTPTEPDTKEDTEWEMEI